MKSVCEMAEGQNTSDSENELYLLLLRQRVFFILDEIFNSNAKNEELDAIIIIDN